ncbi:hypothetical protein EYF80_001617 [Liparis tanakae]|uniref:Uncharacterized protein n=1 Tax=Liparis tanakae TaxID=230148 RepID=A0A4Z2JCT4_9TELE|nr:hypothetical protein EYF80_001617 [Liparis tanakae]
MEKKPKPYPFRQVCGNEHTLRKCPRSADSWQITEVVTGPASRNPGLHWYVALAPKEKSFPPILPLTGGTGIPHDDLCIGNDGGRQAELQPPESCRRHTDIREEVEVELVGGAVQKSWDRGTVIFQTQLRLLRYGSGKPGDKMVPVRWLGMEVFHCARALGTVRHSMALGPSSISLQPTCIHGSSACVSNLSQSLTGSV